MVRRTHCNVNALAHCLTILWTGLALEAYPFISKFYCPSIEGVETEIFGYAEVTNSSAPAELTVYLQGVPVGAPYWIFGLGPIVDGIYDWAYVSDPFELTLFVLARNVTRWYEMVRDQELS